MYATARRPETLGALAAAGCRTLGLHAVLPDRAFDAVLTRQLPRPKG